MFVPPSKSYEFQSCYPLSASSIWVGQSNSHKTTALVSLLISPGLITPAPKRIILCYKTWQPLYDRLASHSRDKWIFEARQGLDLILPEDSKGTIFVIDDLGSAVSQSDELEKLVTTGRHEGISCMILLHNLFLGTTIMKTIAGNVRYVIDFSLSDMQF